MTYSSSLAAGRQRSALNVGRERYSHRGRNAVRFKSGVRTLGPVSNSIILIVLACLLGLMYLSQVTKTNTYGYKINNLQQQQASLEAQHDDLELASARLQSLDRVKSSPPAKNLVATEPTATVGQ